MSKTPVATQAKTASVLPPTQGMLQRKCACGNHTVAGGECADCAKKKSGLQRKLSIGASNDPLEWEADRVADQVLAAPGYSPVSGTPPCIQRFTGHATGENGTAPASVDRVVASSGRPLDLALQQDMEQRFGHDFSQVRVHFGGAAEQSAREVNAHAYTVGHNIVFGAGQYAPESTAGRRIMAHELTHVVQQSGADEIRMGQGNGKRGPSPIIRDFDVQRSPLCLQRLGANPGCTDPERETIHQSIFNARGWLNKAIPQLEADPLPAAGLSSLRRNFGPTYGVSENAPLIVGRLRAAYREISTIPFRCAGAADATCATLPCGYADAGAGGHSATICTNVTLAAGTDWRYQAGCVLHESFHAAFSRFTVDEYSGWHGASGSTATYPGAGTDPLLNADSYTTLAMDLS